MKNKKILSARLIAEGIRQTLVIGVTGMIISIIYALSVGTDWFNQTTSQDGTVEKILLNDFLGIGVLILTVLSFALFFYLFRFINKRSSSDLFESFPLSKSCVLLSYSISVHFWLVLSAISIFVTQLISEKLTNQNIESDKFGLYFKAFLILVVTNLLCCAIHTIGTSLSGTTLTAIFTSFVILLLPQMILLSIASPFGNLIDSINTGVPFAGKNITAIYLISQFTTIYNSEIEAYASDFIYTIVLAVIYFVIGLVLWNLRKSEKAEKEGNNAFLVGTVGFTVGLQIISNVLVHCYMLYGAEINQSVIGIIASGIFISAVICLIIWAVLNKGLKQPCKLLLTILTVAVVDVVLIIIIYVLAQWQLSNMIIA